MYDLTIKLHVNFNNNIILPRNPKNSKKFRNLFGPSSKVEGFFDIILIPISN